MEAKKHSPKFSVVSITPYDLRYIQDAEGETVCDFYYKHGKDGSPDFHRFKNADQYADQLVHAANNIERVTAERDALLSMLKLARKFVPNLKNTTYGAYEAHPDRIKIDNLIASIEGGKK